MLDCLFLDKAGKGPLGSVNGGARHSQPVTGFIEQRAYSDDVVTCLQGRREAFLWTFDVTRAVEEGGRFVAVLPNQLLEVLSCGGVVSAHLSES